MAKPAPEYELILMLDPELPDERRDAIAVDARKRIEAGAELRQERSWGLRKMAYEIQQRNEADYRFFRFANGDPVLETLNHNLRIADGVLRFRIFKVDPGAPVIDPPPPFSLAATSTRPGRRRDGDDRPPRGPGPTAAPPAREAEAAPAEAEAVPAAEKPAEAAAPTEAPAEAAPATEPAGETASAEEPGEAAGTPAGDES